MTMTDAHARVYATVRSIPPGRVMTYGGVAAAAGLPRRARLVGQLMARLPEGSLVPWHRVVNAQGRISKRGGGEIEQRLRLEVEGVRFGGSGAIDLARFGWRPGC
jgi:methylated-DNA-protein-cysteine methyltransferase-like protein